MITMEDLIEEIVGEIHDESEADSERVIEESKGVFVVPGSLELGVLQERLGVPLVEETDCTTVAPELFSERPTFTAGCEIKHKRITRAKGESLKTYFMNLNYERTCRFGVFQFYAEY